MPVYGIEEVSTMLYDAVTLGATVLQAILFQDPLGSGGKTLYDTNMRASGCLPLPESFKIHVIRFSMLPDAAITDVIAMMKGTLTVNVGHKKYHTVPLFLLSAGGGLSLQHEEAGAGTFGYGAFGFPSATNLYVLIDPIEIGQNESFRVELNWPVAPGAKQLWVGLEGLHTRGTQ